MGRSRSLDKPVARVLIRLSILFVLLLGVAIGYVAVKVSEGDRFYGYRYLDQDGDALVDCKDNDVDGDGIPNQEDGDADADGTENWQEAVREALDLVGKSTDILDGSLRNLGVRMGWFRSADVVLVAYEKAGVFLAAEIHADARADPTAYSDLLVGDVVDVHDARALRRFFERRGWLLVYWGTAEIGDVIFLDDNLVALVVDHVGDRGYEVVWASPDTGKVERAGTRSLQANGYVPIGASAIGE